MSTYVPQNPTTLATSGDDAAPSRVSPDASLRAPHAAASERGAARVSAPDAASPMAPRAGTTTAQTPQPVPLDLPQVRKPRPMLLAALGLGVLAEALLSRPQWGVSFPLMAVALLGALAWLGGREGWQRARPNAWLAVPLIVISGFVAVRASPWLRALDVLTSGVLLLLLAHFWGAGRVQRLGLLGYPLVALGSVFKGMLYPPALVRDSVDFKAARQHAPRLMPFARGILIALPVLFVFGVLLESADAAFASAIHRVLDVDVWALFGTTVVHTLGALFAACVAAAVLGHALRRRKGREWGEDEVAPARPLLGLTEALTLILAVDALFLVFAGFQVAYLFIGGASSPAEGYTYAEYARRGFFELLAVSMLTLALVMALARWTRRESPLAEGAFRVGTSLMVALTLLILASAMKRMVLYEDAFGYTRLRVFTHVFMFALGVVLTWRAVTLWWRPERFAIGAFVTALGAVVAVNVLNPDALIVRLNLANPGQWGSDTYYLRKLSNDAVPELVHALGSTGAWHQDVKDVVDVFAERQSQEAHPTWPEWNLANWRARRALQEAGVATP
ncbi:DUF4173 domain-containing protein [Pyxidicoccus fallax]|uniref:DUF4173 domain-containing protein n=1 Tax=Pyxidicoccus fallax TaxID=394095 RepID=A0A848LZ82_9BACT|nr:DUF4173 domain-containing protein [Pyxidicoccus fallax]NMO22643.1 DUF4173 domain-containing protein [Pyxidicoccus fallax]NPC84722.1 DUF4173 domain-containing protein [Pyxidicoccus fallax]